MAGFFSTSKLIQTKTVVPTISRCGSCGLYKTCKTPKMKPTGKGRKKILVIAEAPGKNEDLKGIQLIGESGQLLRKLLSSLGCDLDKDCWKTNSILCRPVHNETPTLDQINACVPNLFKTIKELDPNVIILLGGVSVQAVIGTLRKETMTKRATWFGQQIPCQELNAWICPTYHPAYILRINDNLAEKMLKKHLKKALSKADSKPWQTVPDYRKEVDIITESFKAAAIIKLYEDKYKNTNDNIIAFDYEANCLKPEYPGSEIYSCSVCFDGEKTIAFPWTPLTAEAMKLLLKTPVGKIASNLKFEDRWTRNKLGLRIKNWVWDTMVAAHVIDNQPGITGLKFQSFAMLGQPNYNDHIEPLLSANNKHLNRIHEIDTQDLLLYNGLDSLLEYKIAQIQMKHFKKGK